MILPLYIDGKKHALKFDLSPFFWTLETDDMRGGGTCEHLLQAVTLDVNSSSGLDPWQWHSLLLASHHSDSPSHLPDWQKALLDCPISPAGRRGLRKRGKSLEKVYGGLCCRLSVVRCRRVCLCNGTLIKTKIYKKPQSNHIINTWRIKKHVVKTSNKTKEEQYTSKFFTIPSNKLWPERKQKIYKKP